MKAVAKVKRLKKFVGSLLRKAKRKVVGRGGRRFRAPGRTSAGGGLGGYGRLRSGKSYWQVKGHYRKSHWRGGHQRFGD